jgi:uncharacterized membrane protein YbhN (UPF0104 family)
VSTLGTVAPSPATGAPVHKRLLRIGLWLAGLALFFFILEALGIPIGDWLGSVWDTVTEISAGYLIAGVVFQTLQTYFTALAWVFILRAAYPNAGIRQGPIIATYAVAVAMNGVLPANIGTFVMLLMFVAIVPGANFPGILAGYLVHKIFFTVVGALVYVYLFASVSGSFDIQLGNVSDHPGLTLLIVLGAIVLVVMLLRVFWRAVKKLWLQAKQGGVILSRPREYALKVLVPQAIGYAAKLCVIGVFLAAYSIPVTFHTIMSVVGGNSLANVTSVTPGGVGVNQAINAASLSSVTDSTTATAYSVAQQLITTAWNILFAIVLVAVFFGWTGGKQLVGTSYVGAKEKAAEMRAERKRKKAAQA